jgi:hypothetical protein
MNPNWDFWFENKSFGNPALDPSNRKQSDQMFLWKNVAQPY